MKERIKSPEHLNQKMKISTTRIFIVLIVLVVLIIGGLIFLLSKEIVAKETCLCFAADSYKPSVEALYELVMEDSEIDSEWKEQVDKYYKDVVPDYVQPVYLIIKDFENTEIAEGMSVFIGETEGRIVAVLYEPFDYETLLQLGMKEDEMRKHKLTPTNSYHTFIAFFFNDKPELKVEPGFCNADVILDVVDPSSFILN